MLVMVWLVLIIMLIGVWNMIMFDMGVMSGLVFVSGVVGCVSGGSGVGVFLMILCLVRYLMIVWVFFLVNLYDMLCLLCSFIVMEIVLFGIGKWLLKWLCRFD